MRHIHRLPLSAAALAMWLAVAPSTAVAKPDGQGQRGRGQSSEVRGGHAGKREHVRGSKGRSLDRRLSTRAGDRGRAVRRGAGSRDGGEWRDSRWRDRGDRHDARPRGDVRIRDRRGDDRAEVRWRDSDRRGHAPSYRSRIRYRHDGPGYSSYGPRHYYTRSFHRPRYVYRSGFHLGFVIGSTPAYGYRYFDPYCNVGFRSLGVYYDHCHDHGHPDVILVVDVRSGHPIASCAYSDGYWVVDDCH